MTAVMKKPVAMVVVLIVGATIIMGVRFAVIAGPAGAGFAAKQLCSLVFYAGLDAKRARALYVDPTVFPLNLSLAVDYSGELRQVTVSGFGLFSARAQMRDGLGCTLTTALDTNDSLPPVTLPPVADKPLTHASTDDVTAVLDMEKVAEARGRIPSLKHDRAL